MDFSRPPPPPFMILRIRVLLISQTNQEHNVSTACFSDAIYSRNDIQINSENKLIDCPVMIFRRVAVN